MFTDCSIGWWRRWECIGRPQEVSRTRLASERDSADDSDEDVDDDCVDAADESDDDFGGGTRSRE